MPDTWTITIEYSCGMWEKVKTDALYRISQAVIDAQTYHIEWYNHKCDIASLFCDHRSMIFSSGWKRD